MASNERIFSIKCSICIHYHGKLTCAAFPNEIPEEILIGSHQHESPYPGDNGIRFSPRVDTTQETKES